MIIDSMRPISLWENVLRGIGVSRIRKGDWLRYLSFPEDFDERHIRLHRRVERFTMTRPERIFALHEAIRYIVKSGLSGSFVECGVWKGGSVMAMAYTLMDLAEERDIHLFDTFEGMTEPTEHDVTVKGSEALPIFRQKQTGRTSSHWDYASLEEVKKNVISTGYPSSRFHFCKGRVEETLPDHAPDEIALLRLDTDFYESTRHELIHLYPRVVSGGVVLLDDYGHWKGARQAVDEYMEENGIAVLLNRVDFACRSFVKP